MKKTIWIVSGMLVLTFAAAFLWHRHRAPDSVPVALLAWRASGEMVGSSVVNAGILFLEEHPETNIRMVSMNDPRSPEESMSAVIEAMARGIRFFVTAHPSNSAVAVGHLFAGPDALAIVTGATATALSGRDDFILRVVADAEREQIAIARHIRAMPGERLLVVQDDGNPAYTDPAFETFSAELETSGTWRIVHRKLTVSDFRPDELRSIMAENFDMLYILAGSYQGSIGNIAQLFHHLHPEAPIMLTPWARSRTILEMAGPAIGRIILPSQYPSRHENAMVDEYYNRFQARFGGNMPYSTNIGIRQAFELLDRAFARGLRTPEQVKAHLLGTPVHPTSLGPVAFDRFGDVEQTFHFIDDPERELR